MIIFLEAEKIVLKFGTNSLTVNGRLNYEVIGRIAAVTHQLYSRGQKPVIVTSGAVAAGMEFKHITERPTSVNDLQYLSAKGVTPLSNTYTAAFGSYGIDSVYVPVTWRSFVSKAERESIKMMIERSWAERDITLWNCNDALTNQELIERSKSTHGFYDNDPLAAKLAICISADALVLFSDSGHMGTGGAYSKLRAIREMKKAGIYVAVYSIAQLEEVFGFEIGDEEENYRGIPVINACAVVELRSGKFIVTKKYDVMPCVLHAFNAESDYHEDTALISGKPGRYTDHPHLVVAGVGDGTLYISEHPYVAGTAKGEGIPTETESQFSRRVGFDLDSLLAEATPERPVTLETIKANFMAMGYMILSPQY